MLTVKAGANGPEYKLLPYPEDLPQGVTTGTLLGSTGIQVLLGNYGPDGLVVIDPVDEPHYRYVKLPFRRVDFTLGPAKPSTGYVLTEDGSLHRIDLMKAEIADSAKVTKPYSMDGHWNDPRPRITMAGDEIVVTDPNAGLVRRIATEDLSERHRAGRGQALQHRRDRRQRRHALTQARHERGRFSAPFFNSGRTYQPIRPPPCLVMATTAGRTGMSSRKSGQRVDKSS
ncbi:hypothetical protein ACEPPZ_16850 [Paracoccus yeei]|uniref:hypothetical protein n=1 Tax=Paracoccus yeei TaxID=147645 RepID=UPI0037D6B3E4